MRKTSRIWRAPARGLPRVRMARLLAVVLAGVTDVVLAVFMVVVLAVFSAVVLAVFSAVVMVMVWLVSKLLGVEARVEVVTCSSFTDDSEAVLLSTMKTCRLTFVTSSETETVQVVWKTGLLRDVKL